MTESHTLLLARKWIRQNLGRDGDYYSDLPASLLSFLVSDNFKVHITEGAFIEAMRLEGYNDHKVDGGLYIFNCTPRLHFYLSIADTPYNWLTPLGLCPYINKEKALDSLERKHWGISE